MTNRCWWPGTDPIYIAYHDKEWGVPVREERLLFEFICLEGQQAGLSWITVLKKRDHYRKCFKNFDISKAAKLTDEAIEKLLLDPGLIRNRLKLYSIRTNALAFQAVQKEFGSFESYIWSFVNGKTIDNRRKEAKTVPATTPESDAMAKDLKRRDFKFIGSTICYAFMQAAGLVNDHTSNCFRYKEVKKLPM
ncbi:MAG: DNA-3-methyladenine glycosylase I [Gammaproteobacteria bacterium]|nr:DNA-3-methyladenine glycosylase I [Gammaproteobacteria bacterium]